MLVQLYVCKCREPAFVGGVRYTIIIILLPFHCEEQYRETISIEMKCKDINKQLNAAMHLWTLNKNILYMSKVFYCSAVCINFTARLFYI